MRSKAGEHTSSVSDFKSESAGTDDYNSQQKRPMSIDSSEGENSNKYQMLDDEQMAERAEHLWKRGLAVAYGGAQMKRQFDHLNKKIFLFGTQRDGVRKKKGYKLRWYVLMPDSKFKLFWNMVVFFLLSYTAIVVPYRTAFVDVSSTFMFIVDLVVDILFGIDLFVNLFSAVELDEENYETRLYMIFIHYLKGWFLLDFIACIPFQYFVKSGGSSASTNVYQKLLRLARLPRLYRIMRIVRLFKMMRILKQIKVFN